MNSSFLRSTIAEDAGYTAQHDPAEIVLDANESPYGLPDSLNTELQTRFDSIKYNRYPDSRSESLRETAAEYYGISVDRIVAGNGSDELIGYILLACLDPGDTVLTTEPSFSMYQILGNQFHADVKSVELDANWGLPEDIVNRAQACKIVFLGSPNNPTGNCFDRGTVLQLIEETDALIVLDEAYAEFAEDSLVSEVANYDSLVVLRTLSKAFGLAGARVGFLLGFEAIVEGINTVRLPYNLNSLSQTAGELVLENVGFLRDRWDTIVKERNRLHQFLDDHGFNPCPSEANFILFKPQSPDRLYEHLLRDGIRVRTFDGDRIGQYLRVTVGTPEQNREVRESLTDY
jgi:histidinol-phosphate aminotransferase